MKAKAPSWYASQKKPSWAPPAWLLGPVWTVLYLIIGSSFGYVGLMYANGRLPFTVLVPFLLNLLFNFIFSPIQFGLKNNYLAAADVLLVFATLVWALVTIFPYSPLVAFANLPYLLWVSFASVLQLTVTKLNHK